MEHPKILFSELKSLRLEKQWSQEMLGEMTGLSVRTIQRIEQGHKASLESTKALNAIFQVQFVHEQIVEDSSQPIENSIEDKKEKEAYSKEVKEFMDLAAIGAVCIVVSLIVSITIDSWHFIIWTLIGWIFALADKGRKTFSFIGDRVSDKLMKEKFGNKKTH